MGPYQTPPGLGRDPLVAVFWVVIAPVLFLRSSAYIAGLFLAPFEPGTEAEIAAYQFLWRVNCVVMFVWFALLTYWSDWVGGGAFAGRLRVDARWVVVAIMLGPVLLLVPSFIVDSLMPEGEWRYGEGINTDIFAPQNWTLAYIFMAVILAPVIEEVTFRGIALGALISRGIGPIAAVLLSSAAFALIHMQYSSAAMLVVFISGVGFAILRLLSGTVSVPIIAHAVANADVLALSWFAANPPT
nr:CPBP family intramembrane glutamic endopeptidase [Hyphomonas sp. Mor2]